MAAVALSWRTFTYNANQQGLEPAIGNTYPSLSVSAALLTSTKPEMESTNISTPAFSTSC